MLKDLKVELTSLEFRRKSSWEKALTNKKGRWFLWRMALESSWKIQRNLQSRSELLNLKWNDCELDKNRLTFVDIKNGDDHTISIHPELKLVLLEMHRERIDDDKVFPCQSRSSLNNWIKKLKKITGLGSKRALHQIRHTTATRLVDEGVEIRAIQAVLNHRSIKTTLKYAKALDETKAKAINSLSLAYESGEP